MLITRLSFWIRLRSRSPFLIVSFGFSFFFKFFLKINSSLKKWRKLEEKKDQLGTGNFCYRADWSQRSHLLCLFWRGAGQLLWNVTALCPQTGWTLRTRSPCRRAPSWNRTRAAGCRRWFASLWYSTCSVDRNSGPLSCTALRRLQKRTG